MPATLLRKLTVLLPVVLVACAPDPEAMCKDIVVHSAILATQEKLPSDAPREIFERMVLESSQALANEFGERCLQSVTPELHRCYLAATTTDEAVRNCRGLAASKQSPADLLK